MMGKLTRKSQYFDTDSGCDYFEIKSTSSIEKIKICHVRVNDIKKLSEELTRDVQDTSWMTSLDHGSQRAYRRTVDDTAKELVTIFQKTTISSEVGSEFGELMISIGSTKALKKIFDHIIIPIAELWKPQVKQNEGFDFHTVCPQEILNFGEAKYSGSINPHGKAIDQAKGFIENEKHLRDLVHLKNLVSATTVDNLNNDSYGIVASFSINSANPLSILKNAIIKAEEILNSDNIKAVYLVGISQ